MLNATPFEVNLNMIAHEIHKKYEKIRIYFRLIRVFRGLKSSSVLIYIKLQSFDDFLHNLPAEFQIFGF